MTDDNFDGSVEMNPTMREKILSINVSERNRGFSHYELVDFAWTDDFPEVKI